MLSALDEHGSAFVGLESAAECAADNLPPKNASPIQLQAKEIASPGHWLQDNRSENSTLGTVRRAPLDGLPVNKAVTNKLLALQAILSPMQKTKCE